MNIMKTKLIALVAIFTMSFALNAQVDRTKKPAAGPAPQVKLGKADKFKLKNGLTVIMVENHKLPRASATLTIDNKPYFEGDKAGVSGLMGSLLGRGTPTMTKDQFNERVDFLGANVGFGSSSAFASSLSRYFNEILGLMADGVKNSQFTQEEFDKEVKITLDGIKSSEKSVTAAARRVEDLLTYGANHPFGEFTSKKSVNNITLADVKANYNTYYRPNNAYLIIQGDINPKKMKKLVKKLFNDWEAGVIPDSNLPEIKNVETTEINFVDMPNAVQSEIAVVNNLNLKLGDKDYFAALLANRILGGGGARLYNNLREDKGYTYGSYSRLRQSRYAATFRATASVRNMVTDSSVVEIMKEINKIRYSKVTEKELKKVKAEYVGSFVINVQQPSTVASYALNRELYNLPDDYYEKYLENINAVTIDDVQNAAIKYFKGDKARIFITGKAIDVLKNLEKNENYNIKYFDKYGNATEKPELSIPIPAGVTKESVVNNYFKAIGGVDKIKALKSSLITYQTKINGAAIEVTEKRNDAKYSSVTSMNGNPVIKVLMSKDGISMNGQQLPPAMVSEMTGSLGVFPEFGILNDANAKLTSVEKLEDGRQVYVISTVGKIVSTSFYFDVKTGLKVKESQVTKAGGRTQSQEAFYSDYKDFGGIKFATKKNGSLGPQKVNFTLKDAKVNEGVSDEDFK